MPEVSNDILWWLAAVEFPIVAGLWWTLWKTRRDQDQAIDLHRQRIDTAVARAREALGAYKLEVAKSYASTAQLKDLEQRLTAHLLRIEKKLDDRLSRSAAQS